MADALQRTPAVGELRLGASTARHSAADPLILIGSDGQVRRYPQASTVLLSDVAAAGRIGRTEGSTLQTFENLLNGWTGYTAGTGSRYIQNPANNESLHDAQAVTGLALAQGAGTSGTNAAANARSNTHLFAGAGKQWLAHVSAKNLDRIETLRVGYIGDNSAPTASGRPSNGIWIEYDQAVDSTQWSLVVADDGAYTVDTCGPDVAEQPDWQWFQFVMNSDTSVSLYLVSSTAAPSELSTLASGLPSTDDRRSGRLFAQLVAQDPASGAFAILFLDALLQIPAAGRVPILKP